MGKLDGRVALITGGARGMGAAHARLMVEEGATVVITDVLDDEGAALAEEIGAVYHRLDVTDEDAWASVVSSVHAEQGAISILINNAGVVGFSPIATATTEEWNRVIGINLTGTFFGMRAVIESMSSAGDGVIINISSTAGIQGYSNLSAYVASKWGVRGLTKSAALDLGHRGIRVVSIHPGPIRTPMTDGFGDEMTQSQPIARFGESEEVAKLALFLAADATYSTGTEFIIDGGATVGQALQPPQE
ncbi:glucose 1-dehydrogenase [Microcella alkalica]|uniref:3alpha(Or 20beta)-hydroxysteroid dehydrogenase n=1 Tax=Microcella alkalica TaxID=355930 RepID=A0A839EB19_9MICO|nr:SDR family oxidoreductase [Microcella alkalica]MBA8848363.1 3alpha(or 20beta)-hydroxysteroid dehydrogenase [Microcella alkalica]